MITLHYNNTTLDVQENDSSYRYRAIMQKPQLFLKFSLPYWVDIPLGATCTYMNEVYRLNAAPNIKKNGTRNFEYSLTMGTIEDDMALYKFRNSVDKRLKWSMCAKPHEFIKEIVANLNERSGGDIWKVGTCIEANEKTIEFNHIYIDAALESIAEAFETEWEIVGKTIHLRKVEYFKEDPLPLSYGKGNGFVPGIGRTTPNDEKPIKRLYVQGGERNIDRSEYGSAELLLPKSQTLEYEGRTYQSDKQGYYIERIDKISDAVRDDSLDCSEIYPSRVGKVTKVIAVKPEKNFYDFVDNTIPEDLNFNDYIIEGETPYIRFQSGMLAGEKDFEFKYKHAERRFELVPQEIDGTVMPNATFKPEAGKDTYAIFGIMLPPSYICNNEDKTGASWDMFRAAAKHLYENEEQKFTFSGTLQGLWTKRNWLRVGGRLKVGSYILFSDEQFAQEGTAIRITGIKDFLTSPYTPTIEISNSVSGSSISSQLREIDNQEVVIDDTKKEILRFTKRRFRDAQETMSMLEDSMLNFSNSVSPITVQTMAMLVGDESLQFRFVKSRENLVQDEFNITYDGKAKQLHCPHGFIQHMTLGINTLSSSHSPTDYKVWEMSEYLSPVLTDGSKKYYLYAKVSRADTKTKGDFLLSEKAIDMDAVSGYYHLLVGVLNSEYEEERSYVNLYCFTEILPGRITTDKIVSADGKTFFDLANSVIGGKIDFQDGLVSGLIGIGNSEGINAGMSGAGNSGSDVRFWAGTPTEEKDTAPFRVMQDGSTAQTKGTIGELEIDEQGLHYGDVNNWNEEELKTQVKAGIIRLQNKIGYNLLRVALGDNADPEDDDNSAFMYLYKQYNQNGPQNIESIFKPAFRIISQLSSDLPFVSILSTGSICINKGGFFQAGYIFDVTKEIPMPQIYRIDFMDGLFQVIKNTSGQLRNIFTSFNTEFLKWIMRTNKYAVRLTLVGHKDNNGDVSISTDGVTMIGASSITIKANSVVNLMLFRDGEDYNSMYCLYSDKL